MLCIQEDLPDVKYMSGKNKYGQFLAAIARTEVDLVGYVITPEGIRAQDSKIAAIKTMREPRDVTSIRSFLGLAGYYRQLIPDYAKIAEPLQRLTHKNAKFMWGMGQQKSFDLLRNSLSSEKVMAYPQVNRPYLLYTDASDYAVGGVLTQIDEKGVERPVHYISHQLDTNQRKYAVIEKEAFAVVYALKKLRPYLWGAQFTVYTDHKPLKSLFFNEVKNTRVQRWAVLIAEYGCEI